MLSDEEIREIEAELSHYDQRQAASIEALRIVQRHRGYISDETLADVADVLGISTAELDGVATFYNLIYRKPVGRHVVLVCNSISCWLVGYEGVRDYLTRKLGVSVGETTADGRFTLLPIVCLGACNRGPTMMVDGDLHGNLDPARIDAILEKYP
jgi:NADH-quinone oxidoreductase subunit E